MSYIKDPMQISNSHVLTALDTDKWSYYVKNSVDYDVYHTLHYHMLDKRDEPILFVYEERETFIAIPLLKRSVNHTFCDFTSSYGYSGPVSNQPMDRLDDNLVENFKYAFIDFMQQNQAVSIFSRLNPFINQRVLLDKIGGVRPNGKTVYMDLTQSLDAQRTGYHKRLARQIRQLQKKEYVVTLADTPEQVQLFTAMYNQNMLRLGAQQSYFFNEDYFNSLLGNADFNCKLMLIYEGDEMICGAVVMWSNGVIRNHLSATSESHVHLSPSKLLTDEISLLGRRLGMRYFHLGGGVGGKEDSLFNFKVAFSTLVLEDNIWCFIADEPAYNQLVKEKDIQADQGYFPLYRST